VAVKQVNHLNIVVSDMERSLAFYVGLLQMRVTFEVHLQGEWIERVVGLPHVSARCVFCQPPGGGARFELLQYLSPEGVPYPANSLANTLGLRHFALEVDDIEETYRTLTQAGVPALSPPVVVPFSLVDGVQKSLCYLLDPDGVIVEICQHKRQ
jgi:catechol 2,3-dioxygenase-like lactoylglutathione lyase family enzyme